MGSQIRWPGGKDFAFTVFDDTDLATSENVGPVYSFLLDIGMRTTKSVWPILGSHRPTVGGATCEDEEYLRWVLGLQDSGVEIALHNVAYHTSTREETLRGIERFSNLFGHYPHSMANHTGCEESIYWGRSRLTGINRTIYDLFHGYRNRDLYSGHIEGSPLFWGDLCKDRIKYVRNFVFGKPNTLRMCPFMPYHDADRPYVNYWFAASEGPTVDSFNLTLQEANQDRLVEEGGLSIMYAHFACGFAVDKTLNPSFKRLMMRLSKMNGWFAPVHTILDHILLVRGHHDITPRERNALERRWLIHKLAHTRGRT